MYTCWFILQLLCLHNCCFEEKKRLFEQYYVNMLLRLPNKTQATPLFPFNLSDYADIT